MTKQKQTNKNKSFDDCFASQASTQKLAKKSYTTPTLISYGDVRDVTLGPTVGILESGNEQSRKLES